MIAMVDQEATIADDGTHTDDELGSGKTACPSLKFSESLRDMDKISIYEPTDGKPYPSLRLDPCFKRSLEYKWSNSIILQLVGKSIAFNVLMNDIKMLWKLEREFTFIDIGDNCFVFKSDCDATRLKILSEGPWIINGCYVLPRKWKPEFFPCKDKITSTIAWVRIIGLPLELYDETVLFGIAKILGRPVELDYGTNWSASGKFARLSVEIDLDKPLKSFVMVDEMICSVEYENFSVICNECGKIGHRNEDCSVTLLSRTFQNEEGVKEVTPTEEMLINDHYPTNGQEEEDKRRCKSQAHLYTVIKVSRDEDLKDQIGKDIYFDLVNHDKVSSFRILKQMPFYLFKDEVAKELGIPVQYMRFWKWAKRQNSTYRPHWPLTPTEEVQSVEQLMGVSNNKNNGNLNLFLEVDFRDLHPIPYPKKTEEDILLFFKLYDPYTEQLRYVGRLIVKGSATPAEIMPKLNELAGFSSVEDIELFEERRFQPVVMCECLDKCTSFTFSQIGDGDIICFQKCLAPNTEKQVRFPDVPSYLKYVKIGFLSKWKGQVKKDNGRPIILI